jgi:hypothetical protein
MCGRHQAQLIQPTVTLLGLGGRREILGVLDLVGREDCGSSRR